MAPKRSGGDTTPTIGDGRPLEPDDVVTPDMEASILLTDKFVEEHHDSLHRVLQGNMRVLTMFSDGTVSVHNLLDTVQVAWHSPDCMGGPLSPLLNLALQCKNLRWIETRASGSDNPLIQAIIQRGIVVSTCPGASAIPIAQGVVAGMLTLARQLPKQLSLQKSRQWERLEIEELTGQVCVIVGLGHIGREVAKLITSLRLRVIGVSRHPRPKNRFKVVPLEDVREILPIADWLVLAVPLTANTFHLVDQSAIRLLKRSARIVNVGRGALIDQAALEQALRDGRLRGAVLDVFEQEPLATDSSLWDAPNVIITPHGLAGTAQASARANAHFIANLRRWLCGESLKDRIGVT